MSSNLNVTNFITNSLINTGILRTDHFLVSVPIFNQTFNAIKVEIPEIEFETKNISINTIPIYYISNRSRHELKITFIDNANYMIKSAFYGKMVTNGFNQMNQTRVYFDDFKLGAISVIPLKPDGTPGTYQDKFTDVFVTRIESSTYDINDSDSGSKLYYTTISFKYKYQQIVQN